MAFTLRVNISPDKAIYEVTQKIKESITGQRVDYHAIKISPDKYCIVCVYEKHSWRVGNRLTVTITADNADEYTRVHCVAAGGGAVLGFDYGAAGSFERCVRKALAEYTL